jgi:hypothetical protein
VEPFISTDDLAAILGVTVDPAALITKICLDAACTAVRTYIGQTINYVANDVELHDGRDRSLLRLRQRPVRSVVSIYEDGVLIPATSYVLRGAIVQRTDDDAFLLGAANVSVTYSHGWDVDPTVAMAVPADLRLVALLSARRVHAAVGLSDTSTTGGALTGETMGSYSYSLSASAIAPLAAEFLDVEKEILERYVVRLVP